MKHRAPQRCHRVSSHKEERPDGAGTGQARAECGGRAGAGAQQEGEAELRSDPQPFSGRAHWQRTKGPIIPRCCSAVMEASGQLIPVPPETETFSHRQPRQLFQSHPPHQGLPGTPGHLLPPAQAETSFVGALTVLLYCRRSEETFAAMRWGSRLGAVGGELVVLLHQLILEAFLLPLHSGLLICF